MTITLTPPAAWQVSLLAPNEYAVSLSAPVAYQVQLQAALVIQETAGTADDMVLQASESENPLIGSRVIYLPDGTKRYRIFKNGALLAPGIDYTRGAGQNFVTLTDNQGDTAEYDTYSLCEY